MRLEEQTADLAAWRRATLDEARPEAVAKQHSLGKWTARERLAALCDPDSFLEYGQLAGSRVLRDRDLPADGVITGIGRVGGRPVGVVDYDFAVLGGSQGKVGHDKVDHIQNLALDNGYPIVYLCDGGGARVQELDAPGYAGAETFFNLARLAGWVPQVAVMLGPCFAGHANLAGLCDFVVMVAGISSMGMAGPPLVKMATGQEISKEELGGPRLHTQQSGMADREAPDEAAAFQLVKQYLAFFPSNAGEAPPLAPSQDDPNRRDENLRRLLPDNPRSPYDMRAVVQSLADDGQVLELKPACARNVLTSLIRIEGRPVGVVANQPRYLAGILDTPASDKMAHFINLCDAFGLPIVFLVDVPGFVGSVQGELSGLIRHSAKVLYEVGHASVPLVTVVIRKAYGLGYYVMGSRAYRPIRLLAWPSAEFGGMGLEGGVETIYAKQIAAAADPEKRRAELVEELRGRHTPRLAARFYGIDDIIDPADTRPAVARALRLAPRRQVAMPPKKRGVAPI